MKSLLAEIKSNDGVLGSVVIAHSTGDQWGDLPSVFRSQRLLSLASHIRRLAVLALEGGSLRGMEFCFEQAIVVARFIDKEYLLITFCVPDQDPQLIHLQHNVLIPEFKELLASGVVAAEEEVVPEPVQVVPKKRPCLFRGVRYDD